MLKSSLSMKLKKKLSSKHFIISHIMILFIGLSFLGGLYYILNIQYQKSNNPFSSGPVTSKPKSFKLDLDQPEDELLVFQPEVLVSGVTGPNMKVLISTDSETQVIESKANGSFSVTLSLDEGINNIKVVVFDQTGDTKSEERIIYYSKDKLQ